VEEMGAEDGEERGQDAAAVGADSPTAGRRGAKDQQRRWEDADVKQGEEH